MQKKEIEKLFKESDCLLKNILCFCMEEVQQKTQDIIDIETAIKIILEQQEKIKKTLLSE